MKIIYCIACTCHSGGMERVLTNKANYLARHGYEIVVVTTDQRGAQPFFPLEPSIRSIDLGINYDENNDKSFLNKLLHYPVKQALHRKRLKAVLMKERPNVTVSMFNNDAGFIPGIIVAIKVKPGDTVKKGDTLIILEAMKMENNIPATTAGVIKEICVNTGDSVLDGADLVTYE